MKIYKLNLRVIVLSVFCILFVICFAFSREQEIGLMLRDKGKDVSIAVKPVAESNSPLRIYKDGAVYAIELVDVNHPLATNMRVKVPGEGIKALKKFAPLRGRFICKYGPPKYGWTWIATITCRDASGVNHLINRGANAHTLARLVWDTSYRDINGGNTNAPIKLPDRKLFEALRRSTGGTGGGSHWDNNGTPDTNTLNATCKILGYESYVSSTCLDNQRGGRYPNGKCNFHTPRDNYICYFMPAD